SGSSESSCSANCSSAEKVMDLSSKGGTPNTERPTLNSNPSAQSRAGKCQLSTFNCSWLLHEFDGRAVRIADVYDALASVRTRLKSLRFTSRFPTGCVDRPQNRVEIFDDERDVHGTGVAGTQISLPFTISRSKIFEQFDFVTTRCFHHCELDLSTCDTCDLSAHFASSMLRTRTLEAENVAPKCERPFKIRDRDACVVGGKNAKWHGLAWF